MTEIEDWKWATEHEGFDPDTGAYGIATFANAVQVWAWQNHPATVAGAVAAFKVPAQAIIEAVEWHYWMFLEGPRDDYSKLRIEHEGE